MVSSYPKLFYTVGLGLAVLLAAQLVHHSHRIRHHNAIIKHDYSGVQSQLDLKLGFVDHWCINGDDSSCKCNDPLIPSPRIGTKGWGKAHHLNKALIEATVNQFDTVDVVNDYDYSYGGTNGYDDFFGDDFYNLMKAGCDIAMVGDQFIEAMNGRSMGRNNTLFDPIVNVHKQYLTKSGGGNYDALPLGISGDSSPNLFWRLKHGEMPNYFDPQIWLVMIGYNDLTRWGCSEEIAVLGVMRVIEEIQYWWPDAKIVVSGILPVSPWKDGRLEGGTMKQNPTKKDLEELFSAGANHWWKEHGMIDLWPSIETVNKELEKFCEKQTKMFYFDAGDIFIKESDGKKYIKQDLMSGNNIPNAAGYRKWAKRFSTFADDIFFKSDSNYLDDEYEDYFF